MGLLRPKGVLLKRERAKGRPAERDLRIVGQAHGPEKGRVTYDSEQSRGGASLDARDVKQIDKGKRTNP